MEAAVLAVVHSRNIELLPVILQTPGSPNPTDLFPSDCRIVDEAIDFGRPAKFIRALLDAAIPFELPLHAAASRGTPSVLRLLLERNIGDPTQPDQWGNTPLDIARERRNTEGPKVGQKIMDLLHEYGSRQSSIQFVGTTSKR